MHFICVWSPQPLYGVSAPDAHASLFRLNNLSTCSMQEVLGILTLLVNTFYAQYSSCRILQQQKESTKHHTKMHGGGGLVPRILKPSSSPLHNPPAQFPAKIPQHPLIRRLFEPQRRFGRFAEGENICLRQKWTSGSPVVQLVFLSLY